jgi:glycosidase
MDITTIDERIRARLTRLYGLERGPQVAAQLIERLDRRAPSDTERQGDADTPLFSERDAVLISYGDSLRQAGKLPLSALHDFADERLRDAFSAIHLLPFFPYSSDDGFSVIDFHAVDEALGGWDEIAALRHSGFRLAFDFVLNHISSQSPWFRAYLADPEQRGEYAGLARATDPTVDLTAVVRPRALPLLSPYDNSAGETLQLWTTFSADQIDLNFETPATLLRMIDVMLDYVARGATILRLDAVGFLWKRVGTSCIHLPETHEVVRLFRDVLDRVAPQVLLLTETNVPHAENVSYFGDGAQEAQMVYNFSLPPLLLHALTTGEGEVLSRWAASLETPSPRCTFFNFTASHDGIGVRPLEGLVPDEAVLALAELCERRGGRVSYREHGDGTKSPYELNVTYVDALRGTDDPAGDEHHVARFCASQAIALALPGMPAIYIGSLLANRNWQAGVEATGAPRTVNREKLDVDEVCAELDERGSFRQRVFSRLTQLLTVRRQQPAFSPLAASEVLELHPGVFAIVRSGGGQTLLALTNLRAEPIELDLPQRLAATGWTDLLDPSPGGLTTLAPYQTRWLTEGS